MKTIGLRIKNKPVVKQEAPKEEKTDIKKTEDKK